MKRLFILAATAIMTAIVLTSCKWEDSPVVDPPVVDHGVWSVPDSDMDPTVKAGDDFFMYCNGNWWRSTDLGDKNATGFLRGTVTDALKEKIATLDLPSLPIIKSHVANFSFDEGEDAKAIDELLRPVMEATTLEEAWLETGRMMARGGNFGIIPQVVSVDGKIYYTFSFDISMVPTWLGDNHKWNRHPLCDNPELLARLVPITGSSATRSVNDGEGWPMLVAWFQGMGIDPAYGLTEAEFNLSTAGEAVEGFLSPTYLYYQEKNLEEYKQCIDTNTRNVMRDFLSVEKDKLADFIYNRIGLYESSRAITEKYVTDAMRERTLAVCYRFRDAFAKRINRSSWLDESSKAAALEKLYAMSFNVGGPKEWIPEGFADLSGSKCLVEDVMLLLQAKMNILKKVAGKSVSENAFTLLTSTFASLTELNASYIQMYNAMFIYPAIIMDPLWPDNANEAIIYAAASSIGHEITHGFDASGYKFNKYGSYGPIFTSEKDKNSFATLTQQLVDWYNTLEVMPDELPGLFNVGERTLAENIADLGGFEIAFEAYTNKLKEDGFKDDELRLQQQRFYQAYAHVWQSKYTADYATERTIGTNEYASGSDNHSLERERVNGVVANTDAWYELFNVMPGQKLYRAPAERVHIW